MKFELTVLGSNSAIPTANRHPSAHLLNVNERFYLIDCGEGTQMQLRKYKFKFQRIGHIFISHLHGDHFFGLIGLLTTMNLLGREMPLVIHAHEYLKRIIDFQLNITGAKIDFPINYNYLPIDNRTIMDDGVISVRTIQLDHRTPCCGFVFEEKPKPRKLIMGLIKTYDVPVSKLKGIKAGEDFITRTGKVISNSELTEDPDLPRIFAYCTDTRYKESIVSEIEGIDLLYHESTFTEEHKDRAKATYHCTAKQAATIAKKSNVKKLLLGHYSVRYNSLAPLLEEAREVFHDSYLSEEGKSYTV